MLAFQRIVQCNDITGLGYLIINGIAGDRGRVTIVRNALGDDADYAVLTGIILFEAEFYPIETIGFQDDGPAVPLADKVMMNSGGQHEVAVSDKKEFGCIVGIVGYIRITEHVRFFAGFDDQSSGVPVKVQRDVVPG